MQKWWLWIGDGRAAEDCRTPGRWRVGRAMLDTTLVRGFWHLNARGRPRSGRSQTFCIALGWRQANTLLTLYLYVVEQR